MISQRYSEFNLEMMGKVKSQGENDQETEFIHQENNTGSRATVPI
jgi:hypothetical protein